MSEKYVNPYIGVVVDLVDPYFTPSVKNTGGFKVTSASNAAIWWIRRHPGRWALVGEGGTGLVRHLLQTHCPDLQIKERRAYAFTQDGILRTYARVPHPEGEPLLDALQRRPIASGTFPEVTRDPFNWSPAELAEACQIARDNLFPVS